MMEMGRVQSMKGPRRFIRSERPAMHNVNADAVTYGGTE